MFWLLGGIAFLLALRFAAGRYWIPFIFPILLCLDRQHRHVKVAISLSAILSLLLAWDDRGLANSHHQLSRLLPEEKGLYAGHWGFQYYAEKQGWVALEDDALLSTDQRLAIVKHAWPQEPLNSCLLLELEQVWKYTGVGIRVHSEEARANVHSQLISLGNIEPIEVYSAWGIGFDPWEELRVYRVCGP